MSLISIFGEYFSAASVVATIANIMNVFVFVFTLSSEIKIITSYIIAVDQLPNCQFLTYHNYTHHLLTFIEVYYLLSPFTTINYFEI